MRVGFKTIGCRLNQAETARMAGQFRAAGYDVVDDNTPCEVYVVHGCAVTGNAVKDTIRAGRKNSPAGHSAPTVVIAGCATSAYREAVARSLPDAILADQDEKTRLPALLHRMNPSLFPPPADEAAVDPDLPLFGTVRAIVKVQDGCDFNCAYCIVPRARGAPRSRATAEIITEVRRIVERGYNEIILSGANLGCYRDGSSQGLADLIRAVSAIDGIARIRLSSLEITTAERPVIDLMAHSSKICRFLHIPLQSGSDPVLRAMGRRYTAAEFRATIEYALQHVPRIGLGTDVLVGFPGETDADFEATYNLIAELPFSNLHVFRFSSRPGTRAAALKDPVPVALKKARVRRLVELGHAKRREFARGFIGRPVEVLVEKAAARGVGQGWTGEYLQARIHGSGLKKRMVVNLIPDRVEEDCLIGTV